MKAKIGTLRKLAFVGAPAIALMACSGGDGEPQGGTESSKFLRIPPACTDGTYLPQYDWGGPSAPPWFAFSWTVVYGKVDLGGSHGPIVWEELPHPGTAYAGFVAVDVGYGGAGPATPLAVVYVPLGQQLAFAQYNPSAMYVSTVVGGGPCPGPGGGSACFQAFTPKPDVSCIPTSLIRGAIDDYFVPLACDQRTFCP